MNMRPPHSVPVPSVTSDIGPQSVEEMYADLSVAEKEMKDPQQWDTLNNFMTGFKQTHAAWFK